MRQAFICGAVLMAASTANAQNFATSEQPDGVTTSISTGQRVERVYAAPQPATASEIEPVYSVPVYDAYQPTTYDAGAYQQATQPAPLLPAAPVVAAQPDGGARPYGEPVDVTPTDAGFGTGDFSQPLGSPQTYAAASPQAPTGEVGFAEESETSRLLLALEDTFAKRTAALRREHLEQRKALLAKFEAETADPEKVIGLAERMRSGIAALEAAQKAALAVEESQYSAAMLQVLDRAPSRVE